MEVEEFRVRGKQMIDYMCEYLTTIGKRRVTPDVEPGYLSNILPDNAPEHPEKWDDIMQDVENKIMPGVTHWQHPRFHAYFPSGNSFPSILGDMLSDAIGCIGFSWAASPACTELESIVLDWLCRALGLPEHFLAGKYGYTGGGCIQTSASECIFVCMLAARHRALTRLANEAGEPPSPEGEPILLRRTHHLPKLVAYCSTEAHSCVEKAAGICLVRLRAIETNSSGSMCPEKLKSAIVTDLREGLVPFFVSTTFGSTASTSFDDLVKIAPIVKDLAPDTWIHIDAAYAGNALLCPELRPLMPGIENADSFNTNPNKWMLTNFDCSLMWVKDRYRLTDALTVNPLYLHHVWANEAIDYRHWGVPLSRRFRALKLWFVLRTYGLNGLRDYIRRHVYLAARFAAHVRSDPRFEVTNNPRLGLVCFRLLGKDNSITPDRLTHELLVRLNSSGLLHVVPANVNGSYSIRVCVNAEKASERDVDEVWRKITDLAQEMMEPTVRKRPPPLARMKSRRFSFTRSVSREMYARTASRTNLYDGATPILVPEDEFEFPEENGDGSKENGVKPATNDDQSSLHDKLKQKLSVNNIDLS